MIKRSGGERLIMFGTILSVECTNLRQGGYIIYLLDSLIEISDDVFICVSRNIEKEFIEELNKRNVNVILCSDGIAINRWKSIILSNNKLRQYDYILFADDSMFGPFYSLKGIKREIIESKSDMWGLTLHERIPYYINGEKYSGSDFIQTYFFALANSIISSDDFIKYLQEMPYILNYEQAAQEFEYKFTELVGKWGFTWKSKYSFVRCYNSQLYMSHILFDIRALICFKGFPFLPRYLFFINRSTLLNYNLGDELRECIRFIRNNTDYKDDYIFESVMPELSPNELHERLNLEYICEYTENTRKLNCKSAVFVYLFYLENLDEELRMLENVPQNFDLYIGADDEQKIVLIKNLWKKKKRKNTIKFILHKHRGRDISALLLTFRKYIVQYEIFCFIHDKKSTQMGYPTIGNSFNMHLWECLLGSQSIVNYAVTQLLKDKRLGILAPPFIFEGMYFNVAINPWTICYKETEKLILDMKLNVKISEDDYIIFLGSCFWAKTKALEKLLLYEFKELAFPEEPCPIDGTINHCIERIFSYVALDAGFYTGHVLSVDIAERELITQKYMLTSILKQMNPNMKIDITTFEDFVDFIKLI